MNKAFQLLEQLSRKVEDYLRVRKYSLQMSSKQCNLFSGSIWLKERSLGLSQRDCYLNKNSRRFTLPGKLFL